MTTTTTSTTTSTDGTTVTVSRTETHEERTPQETNPYADSSYPCCGGSSGHADYCR